MSFRALATLLLTIGFMLSTLGCIKEPISVAGTGSYKLNGIERNCHVQADVTNPSSRNQVYDQLDIQLLTIPEPASGPEVVVLTFSKLQSQPSTAYQLLTMHYRTASGVDMSYSVNTVLLQETNGKYGGTFSAPSANVTSPPVLDITDGTFADTRP